MCSISHQNFNTLEVFDMNDLEILSLNEDKTNLKIRDDEEENELLVSRPRVFKKISRQTMKIGHRWLYHVKHVGRPAHEIIK